MMLSRDTYKDQSEERILFNVKQSEYDSNERPQTPVATHRGLSRHRQSGAQLMGRERPHRFKSHTSTGHYNDYSEDIDSKYYNSSHPNNHQQIQNVQYSYGIASKLSPTPNTRVAVPIGSDFRMNHAWYNPYSLEPMAIVDV